MRPRNVVCSQSMFLMAAIMVVSGAWAYERAALAPAESDIRLRISDVAGCTSAVPQSSVGRFWQDDGVQAFLGRPDGALLVRGLVTGTNGMSAQKAHLLAEQLRLLKGEVIVAIDTLRCPTGLGTKAQPDPVKDESAFYLVAQMPLPDYKKSLELDRQIADLDKQKTTLSHVEFQGQDLAMIVERGQDGRERRSWQTCLNDTFLGSNRKEWIEQTVARIKREGPPSAGRPETPSVDLLLSGAMITDALKTMIAAMPALTPGGAAAQGGNDPVGPVNKQPKIDAAAVLKALGLDTLKSLRFNAQFEQTQARLKIVIDRGSARRGLWALVVDQAVPEDLKISYVPANVDAFTVTRVNLLALWQEIPGILQAIDPGLPAMFAMLTGMLQQSVGINLDTEVMANLDTLVISSSCLQDNEAQILVAWQLKDAKAMDAVLKRLIAKNPAAGEEFRGVSLLNLPCATNFAGAAAVVGNQLYFGNVEQVRGAIRAQTAEKPAAAAFLQAAIYRDMLKNKPAGSQDYSLTDMSASVLSWFSAANVAKMKLALAQQAGSKTVNPAMGAFLKGIDFSKMPPAEKMASFFGPLFEYNTVKGDLIEHQCLFKYQKQP